MKSGAIFWTIASILLVFLVVVAIIVLIYPDVQPLVKAILGLNDTAFLSPTEKARDFADVFFENYKKCVEIDDTNCKCIFDLDLEKGYVIRLLKEEDYLRILLMEGGLGWSEPKLNKIVGDINQDIDPCIYVGGDKKISSKIDIGDKDKLKINNEKYILSEKFLLYKIDNNICVVPSKKGWTKFNIENILELSVCGEEKIEKFKIVSCSSGECVAELAKDFVKSYGNLPYRRGSCTIEKGGFDCVGFVSWVLQHAGIIKGNTHEQGFLKLAREQGAEEICSGKSCNIEAIKKKAKPGDLIFAYPHCPTSPWKEACHVAIYVGDGEIVDSSGIVGLAKRKIPDEYLPGGKYPVVVIYRLPYERLALSKEPVAV